MYSFSPWTWGGTIIFLLILLIKRFLIIFSAASFSVRTQPSSIISKSGGGCRRCIKVIIWKWWSYRYTVKKNFNCKKCRALFIKVDFKTYSETFAFRQGGHFYMSWDWCLFYVWLLKLKQLAHCITTLSTSITWLYMLEKVPQITCFCKSNFVSANSQILSYGWL